MKGAPVFLPPSAPAALVESVKQAGGVVRSSKEPVEVCKDVVLSGELRSRSPSSR